MIGRRVAAAVLAAFLMLLQSAEVSAGPGLFPDLVAGWPKLNVPEGGREEVRVTTAVGNRGPGALDMHPDNGDGITDAWQWVHDAGGNVVARYLASQIYFHEDHDHFHMTGTSAVEVRRGGPTGPVVSTVQKITFCFIDFGRINLGGLGPDKFYKDCYSKTNPQGISAGFYDPYHHSIPGQEVVIPAVPGLYTIVNKANPNALSGGSGLSFKETDYSNNIAWMEIQVFFKGNALKVRETGKRGGKDAFVINSNR